MAKQDTMEAIEREWNVFTILAESFSEENRIRPGAVGHWNVHEALIHVADWDNEVIKLVREFHETGKKPEYLGGSVDTVDQLNEKMVSERRDLAPSLIWEYFRGAHKALMEFLSTCGEHVFWRGSFSGESINGETWQHYMGHGEDLARFRELL